MARKNLKLQSQSAGAQAPADRRSSRSNLDAANPRDLTELLNDTAIAYRQFCSRHIQQPPQFQSKFDAHSYFDYCQSSIFDEMQRIISNINGWILSSDDLGESHSLSDDDHANINYYLADIRESHQQHKASIENWRNSELNNIRSSVEDRLNDFEHYLESNGLDGRAIREMVLLYFPELKEIDKKENLSQVQSGSVGQPLPTEAPEIYGGLRGPETPPEFVKRVYAPWLGQGLDRAHIKHLDPKLYTAIDNWTRKPGNEWPADVDLPTRGEQTRRTIEQLKQEAPDGRIGKVLGDFTAREAQRIRAAVRRQEQKR